MIKITKSFACLLFFVSVAVAKGQTAEQPLMLVGQGTKEQTDLKHGSVSTMMRVKQLLSLGGAVAMPIASSFVCVIVTGKLCKLSGIDPSALCINRNERRVKLLQFSVSLLLGSAAGSGGGFLATKLLPNYCEYKTKVAAGATLPIPLLVICLAIHDFYE